MAQSANMVIELAPKTSELVCFHSNFFELSFNNVYLNQVAKRGSQGYTNQDAAPG